MKRLTLTVAATLPIALALSSCNADAGGGSGDKDKTITIGLLAPLTGDSAADGQGMKTGLDLAVKELNSEGGVAGYKFRTKVVDTGNLQSDAVAAGVQKLISDDQVKAVLTSYASSNNFEIDNFAKVDMPYIVAANADQTKAIISKEPDAYETIWSIVPDYAPFGTELPRVIEQWDAEGKLSLRDKSAFIITSDNPFSQGISQGLTNTLKDRGWTVVGDEKVPFGAVNDWGSILTKIRAANPDLIIDTDYLPANEATFLKQFIADPTNSIMFMQYGPSIPEFLELTKRDSTGVLYNVLGDAIQSERFKPAAESLAHLRELSGKHDLNNQTVALYWEMKLYADALAKVGDPNEKSQIGKVIGASGTQTPFGTLEFDPKTHLAVYGDDKIPLQFLQIEDGKRVLLSPDQYATGEFKAPPWYSN